MMSELLHSFEFTVEFLGKSVADLSDQQMVEQPPGVPNHATWTLGHVIFSCQGVAAELGTEAWLPGDWEAMFGYGSTPSPELARYPNKAKMLSLLTDAKVRLRRVLEGTADSTFQQAVPDKQLPTLGDVVLQVVAAHTAYHAGQLAVWRRAIGKAPAGVFV